MTYCATCVSHIIDKNCYSVFHVTNQDHSVHFVCLLSFLMNESKFHVQSVSNWGNPKLQEEIHHIQRIILKERTKPYMCICHKPHFCCFLAFKLPQYKLLQVIRQVRNNLNSLLINTIRESLAILQKIIFFLNWLWFFVIECPALKTFHLFTDFY